MVCLDLHLGSGLSVQLIDHNSMFFENGGGRSRRIRLFPGHNLTDKKRPYDNADRNNLQKFHEGSPPFLAKSFGE
jgi:hypothetical protein